MHGKHTWSWIVVSQSSRLQRNTRQGVSKEKREVGVEVEEKVGWAGIINR